MQKVINGSTYSVPVGMPDTWKPGQAFNAVSASPSGTGTPKPDTAALQPATTQGKAASTPSYQSHLDWFGSPEAYAKTIMEKGWENLDDPAAAGSFMKDYNSLFQQNIPVDKPALPDINALLSQLTTSFQPMDMNAILSQIMAKMPQTPAMGPTLTGQEATQRATAQLDPLYGETLEQALKDVDNFNIRRGFFGQVPGAALSRSTAADINTRKAQAIGQLSNQLVGQSEEGARANQALAQQQFGQEANMIMSAFNAAQNEKQAQMGNLINAVNALLALRKIEDDNKYQEAGITGLFKGQPTLQASQAEKEFGFKTSEAEKGWDWQEKQWNASPESQSWYLPNTQKIMERDASAPYFKPDSPDKPDKNQVADNYIRNNKGKHSTPIQFIEGARRDYEAGLIDGYTFQQAQDYVMNNFDPYQKW